MGSCQANVSSISAQRLRHTVRLAALQTPVSEVIAASRTDQWGARADVRAQGLVDRLSPVPRVCPAREFEDLNLASAPRPRSRASGAERGRRNVGAGRNRNCKTNQFEKESYLRESWGGGARVAGGGAGEVNDLLMPKLYFTKQYEAVKIMLSIVCEVGDASSFSEGRPRRGTSFSEALRGQLESITPSSAFVLCDKNAQKRICNGTILALNIINEEY
ncbi:unnamed protein product [Leptidea sinapis]|uniref:Uncharacterized protein n=1 Tax=Leptidea sinapis TaxID=189913 RepID=A0A5E4PQT0_9NEOP|nr:unnamed protein product [Leptidea sinapis]